MQHIQYDANLCIMTRFSAMISGKWKPILLFLIQQEVNRFGQMKKQMPAISRKMLTEQLRELETDGLISRIELKAKAPKVVVYQLSEKGLALRKLLDEMIRWAMTYMKDEIPQETLAHFISVNPAFSASLPWMDRPVVHASGI